MNKRRPRVKFFDTIPYDPFLGIHDKCTGKCTKNELREFFRPDYAEEAEAAANAVQNYLTSADFLQGLLYSGSTSRLEAYHSSLIHLNLLGTFSTIL